MTPVANWELYAHGKNRPKIFFCTLSCLSDNSCIFVPLLIPLHAAHEATIISSVSSILIFTLAVLGYVGMVYYHDKKREMYNSSWIFNEGDLHFISGGQSNARVS